MTDVLVSIEQDRYGNLTVNEVNGDEDLFFQGDDVDYFLNNIVPENFHTEYVGKRSARDKVNELIQEVKEGYTIQALIDSLYFGDSYNEGETIPFTAIDPNDEPPNINVVSTGICERCGVNVLNLYRSCCLITVTYGRRFAYICTNCYKKEQKENLEDPMCPIGTITVITENKMIDGLKGAILSAKGTGAFPKDLMDQLDKAVSDHTKQKMEEKKNGS